MSRKLARTLAVALAAGALGSVASGQSTLSTLYATNNNGSPGGIVYFNLTIGPSPVTITSVDVNTLNAAGSTFGFSFYTVLGGFAGHEGNAGDWTLQTTGTGTAAGTNLPSPVVLNGPVVLQPLMTYGIGLVLNGGGGAAAAHAYTNGTGANQTYMNADMTLLAGEAENVPFTLPVFTPRVWNGTIHYSLGGTLGACCIPTTGACVQTTMAACLAQGGLYRGDNSPCSTANCPQPPTGACCSPTGTCSVLTQVACTAAGGTYRGDNTTCGSANCVASIWAEQGDAGDLPATAQVVSAPGATTLTQIQGSLTAADADMYEINICSPGNFSAFVNANSTVSDTQMFLFDSTGAGVSMDDDDPQGTGGLRSRLTSQFVGNSGNYYLAISSYDNDPRGATTGGEIWADTPFNVERRPDGPAAGEVVGSWDGAGSNVGTYQIDLTGSCFVSTGSTCYPNCDQSTTVPFLNVNDFICFQGRFAAGDTYANCDHSTMPPVLNVNDFICFQSAFAAGCSAP